MHVQGSRRSFSMQADGTYIKTLLARELQDCNHIKVQGERQLRLLLDRLPGRCTGRGGPAPAACC